MSETLDALGNIGLVPVVAIERAQDAPKLGQALLEGNLPCAEITFRTHAAAEAIQLMSAECPGVLVGAGTVMTIAQAEQAVAAGAKFIVSPGFDAAVVDWCLQNEVPVTPGVLTPTEINMALNKGLRILKFFPAEAAGGIRMLKSIAGPYTNVKFIPTGGINAHNLADYLRLPLVHACGGSWVVKKTLISDGQFETITALARQARAVVNKVREATSC